MIAIFFKVFSFYKKQQNWNIGNHLSKILTKYQLFRCYSNFFVPKNFICHFFKYIWLYRDERTKYSELILQMHQKRFAMSRHDYNFVLETCQETAYKVTPPPDVHGATCLVLFVTVCHFHVIFRRVFVAYLCLF